MNTNVLAFPTAGDAPQTMSSREIAELTGKHHNHVCRDIEAMLESLQIDASRFGSIYKDAYGRDKKAFALPYELTLTLVSGYKVVMRHGIVRRWHELESKQSVTPQLTRSQQIAQALLLANDEIQELQHKVKEREYALLEASPKVEFYETVVGKGNAVPMRIFSKMTVYGPYQLNRFLRDEQILMRVIGTHIGLRAYSEYMDKGWFILHDETRPNRVNSPNITAWITPKGIDGLWQRYGTQLFTKTSTAARTLLSN